MNYKVSVIIPVYNAEDSLKTTIQSIINQSIGFENIELILVDDNSKDNSKKIIESYCEKYDNIVPYYSNDNHGSPGYGRNIGLSLVTSDYIMFLDNDDEYEKDMCKTLYETIISEDVDLVVCNKISVDHLGSIKQHLKYKKGTETENYVLIENDDMLLFDSTAVWSKIFKKDIIEKNKIRFLENTHADDISFSLDYYLKSKELIFLKNYHGIYWNIYDDSLSHVVSKKFMKQLLDTYYYMFKRLKEENKQEYANPVFEHQIEYTLLQCSYLKLDKKEFEKILNDVHNFEKEIEFNSKLSIHWEIINKFILSKHYTVARLLLKSLDAIRNIGTLRKINRKIT